MDASAGLETIETFSQRNATLGFYPATAWAVRYLFRERDALGLAGAFHRVGSRILVDRERFYGAIAQRREREAAARSVTKRPLNEDRRGQVRKSRSASAAS